MIGLLFDRYESDHIPNMPNGNGVHATQVVGLADKLGRKGLHHLKILQILNAFV